MESISKTISTLKETGQDYEFYPTTNEIISIIKDDLDKLHTDYRGRMQDSSILDCGAGNGVTVSKLAEHETISSSKVFAIEKSQHLISLMDNNIKIIGTDFYNQTLIDKELDIIFCNPPYSMYECWCEKIIREANCKIAIYLVIPKRWVNSLDIKSAINARGIKANVLGTLDFLSADRKARAVVDVVKLSFNRAKQDPFKIWFDKEFKMSDSSNIEDNQIQDTDIKKTKEVVDGACYIESMCSLYNTELTHLLSNYKKVCELDSKLMNELFENVMVNLLTSLKSKIKGLKYKYWNEMFNRLSTVTDRLATKQRKQLLETLMGNTSVDFTSENIYAVIIWVTKNTSYYIDEQLVSTYERLISPESVILYKSNQKVYKESEWRYNKPTHYKLDYRIVVHNIGGVYEGYEFNTINNIKQYGYDYIQDVLTVLNTLGYKANENLYNIEWVGGRKEIFTFTHDGVTEQLLEIKIYKNGNMHMKFNKKVMLRWNVEFGRIKGWLNKSKESADELNASEQDLTDNYNKVFNITDNLNGANLLTYTG